MCSPHRVVHFYREGHSWALVEICILLLPHTLWRKELSKATTQWHSQASSTQAQGRIGSSPRAVLSLAGLRGRPAACLTELTLPRASARGCQARRPVGTVSGIWAPPRLFLCWLEGQDSSVETFLLFGCWALQAACQAMLF